MFDLTPLGDLPDEANARALGKAQLGQDDLGPADTVAGMGDLLSGFDTARLTLAAPVLPGAAPAPVTEMAVVTAAEAAEALLDAHERPREMPGPPPMAELAGRIRPLEELRGLARAGR